MERLFVYGTLAPGEENFHLVEGINGHWESATCYGRIFTQTKGAHIGLPRFEPSIKGERVEGKIFSSTELINYWDMLDKFEGELYQRRLIPVKTGQGEELEAYVYAHIDAV
ncbi:MAG: gamma-glutamylcyclotransferase (GGCT)/AIG2-like uncharacterized protein YtfP [Flavobacteriaceae bacterium]|jgi:gamma-glutamylcyclotransferase (GGCT)/AIG2-like uncharacterized protein YtfP